MLFSKKTLVFKILWVLLFFSIHCLAATHHHFEVVEAPYTRLCSKKKILTVNGQFPGPALHVHHGDTIYVTVHNKGIYNITIHWHGVKLPGYPWSDGPEYITQCPIKPGGKFRQKIIFSTEEGTLWWHAHSDWSRATVHGPIIVYPKINGAGYPLSKSHVEVPIVLGQWWKKDVMDVLQEAIISGGDPEISDALTINGQPGDLYPCSKSETFKLNVDQGKSYLLRIVNAALNNILFFSIANHNLTVIGIDGSYTKPLTSDYITIATGQTIDAVLHANQDLNHYYMASRVFTSNPSVSFDNTTTTAIVQYNGNYTSSSSPSSPQLPYYNDTDAAYSFLSSLRSLADEDHPVRVPINITNRIVSTLSKMMPIMRGLAFQVLKFLLLGGFLYCQALVHHHTFVVKDAPYTRLCSTKKIMTVNGQFPGPTLYVTTGETIVVDVINRSPHNITMHWHGVKQPNFPWSDGPEYITQCPVQPGGQFRQKERYGGMLTVTGHEQLFVHKTQRTAYPYPTPHEEVPIILGEWWKKDIFEVFDEFKASGADPNVSDAYTINGQPGDLLPCSKSDTFKLSVQYGKTYLLRLINAALQDILFFSVANHQVTVVGTDASYTKPLRVDYLAISPGQTIDVLLEANQPPDHYYMAAKVYSSASGVEYDNTTTTAIVQYRGNYTPSSTPSLPHLPAFNDTTASANFTGRLRSLADKNHPIDVPLSINTPLFFTLSVNKITCANTSCGTTQTRLAASVNNISFQTPTSMDVLRAYYNQINGVYGDNFPDRPSVFFNFTADSIPQIYETPTKGTEVRVLKYNSTVEIVFQGTNVAAGTEHPMHIHGTSFYVVGWGFGNFDKDKDPLKYNLVDPPLQNTIAVPKNGWSVIRFRASNPGKYKSMVRALPSGAPYVMGDAFIIRNGHGKDAQMLPPPPSMPPC
uniref:Laccase n=1 Tax=Salix viminalis TaxID=40686 RepID=A0A6N2NGL5_SALVM